jgi:hypothetical protein
MKGKATIFKRLIVGMCVGLFLAGSLSMVAVAADGEKLTEYFKKEVKPTEPLIPPTVKMETTFKPGKGDPVGKVQKLQGDVYVMHQDEAVAYRLTNGSPLFAGDTIVTMADSMVNILLNDKSVVGLASYAKLSLDKVQFSADKQERDSSLKLLWGRARFMVQKLTGQKSNYFVNTPTSVCAVRGSDYALYVGPVEKQTVSMWQRFFNKVGFISEAHAQVVPIGTVVLAGQNTTLVVTGMVGPAQTLTSLTVAVAGTNIAVTLPVAVPLAAATAAFNAVAPGLAALSMPPGFD